MSIRNKVQLVGHVGQTPEIKTFGDSGKLARFSIATNENYKDQNGQWQTNTTWHNLIAWRNVAERIEQFVQKGSHLMIEGKIVNRDYTDKDNVKRYVTEIDVRNFLILDKKNDQAPNTNAQQKQSNTADFYKASVEDDDLPF